MNFKNRIKRLTRISLVFILFLCLFACSKEISKGNQSSENSSSASGSESGNCSLEDAVPPDSESDYEYARVVEETIAYYSELYATELTYQDKYVSQKYLLIGDTNMVELYVFDSYNQTKVMQKKKIERVENQSLPDFNQIQIYDKTNQCISIILDAAQAAEVLQLLQ